MGYPLFSKEKALKVKGLCPFCSTKVDPKEFTDPIDYREFQISGLCKKCQDDFFNGEDSVNQ